MRKDTPYIFVVQDSDYDNINDIVVTTDIDDAMEAYCKESPTAYGISMSIWWNGREIVGGRRYYDKSAIDLIVDYFNPLLFDEHNELFRMISTRLRKKYDEYNAELRIQKAKEDEEKRQKDMILIDQLRRKYPDQFK